MVSSIPQGLWLCGRHEWCLTSGIMHSVKSRLSLGEKMLFTAGQAVKEAPCAGAGAGMGRVGTKLCLCCRRVWKAAPAACPGRFAGAALHPQPHRDLLLCSSFVSLCFGDKYEGGFKFPGIPGFVKVYFSLCSKTGYSEFIALFELLQWSKSKLLVLLLHCLLQKFYFCPRTYWLCSSF